MPNPRMAVGRPGSTIAVATNFRFLRERMTSGFIETAPVSIVLVPRTKTSKPAGGFAWTDGTPRVAQLFRFTAPTDPPHVLQGSDGVEREVHLVMVGEPTAVLGLYDYFTYQGHRHEVVQILFVNDFETRAEVSRIG